MNHIKSEKTIIEKGEFDKYIIKCSCGHSVWGWSRREVRTRFEEHQYQMNRRKK